jgi:type VII secretion integral membrane protein EccD
MRAHAVLTKGRWTGVTAPGGLGLARVTVAAPKRRVDVALPDNLLVGELLPHLVRHAGEEVSDDTDRQAGWTLRRATGAVLEPTRNLAVQGVRDGELLQLVPRRLDWPELAYDDVVEAIASGARQTGRSWSNLATRRCGLAVTSGALGLGLAVVALSGPPWTGPAGLALGLAGLLVVVGVVAARAFGDATAGAVVAATGLPYGFAGGALLAGPNDTPLTQLGLPSLLLGSAVLLVLSIVGYTGVAAAQQLFTAGLVAGLAGLLAAFLQLTGVSPAGAAAVTLTAVIALLPGYPLFASWLGKLPRPELPDRPEGILADRPVPRRADVFTAVARSTELLTGMLLAAAVVSTATSAFLVAGGSTAGHWLTFAAAAALLLRARLFPTPKQRIPLLVGGLAGLALLAFGAAMRVEATGDRLPYLFAIVAVAVIALAAGQIYSRRSPSPYIGRFADIADVLAIMALLPLAGAVSGVYDAIRNLFASIGG